MSELYTALLAVALSWPAAWVERDEPGAAERHQENVELAVRAVVSATDDPSVAMGALRIAWEETKFADYVRHGCVTMPPKASGNCDRIMHGKHKGKIRARSWWQLWTKACPKLWALPVGTDLAVYVAARCAVRQWRSARIDCARRGGAVSAIAGAFAGYRSRMWCGWPPAAKRAYRYEKAMGRYHAERARIRRER